MNCLKCGREAEEGNAFCPGCLEEMGKSPVSANTVVVLPSRRAPAKKAPLSHRRVTTQQELLQKYRRRCRRLALATLILTILLTAVIGLSSWMYFRRKSPPTGQNYTAIPSAVSSSGDPSGS